MGGGVELIDFLGWTIEHSERESEPAGMFDSTLRVGEESEREGERDIAVFGKQSQPPAFLTYHSVPCPHQTSTYPPSARKLLVQRIPPSDRNAGGWNPPGAR